MALAASDRDGTPVTAAAGSSLGSSYGALRDLIQRQTRNWRRDEFALAGGITVCIWVTMLIAAFGSKLHSVPHPHDLGETWYYWVLSEPTVATRATVWILYLSHQVLHLATVHYALLQHHNNRYSHSLRPLQQWMLGMNLFFIIAHSVQSHLTYDGLAQDLPLLPSLGLAGIMLTWILLMENNRRGLWFGFSIPFPEDLILFARKYHGYYFSIAIVAVFWFHPLEGSPIHLSGLFYNLLLLLQSCLFLTPIHYKRYWTFTLEAYIVVHGTIVGYCDANKSWSMYFFWFAMIFVVTQMHGLDLNFSFKLSAILLMIVSCKEMFSREGARATWWSSHTIC